MARRLSLYGRYFGTIVRHKWFVFCYNASNGFLIHALLHDLSKFLPDEFFPYANFYGKSPEERTSADKDAFLAAENRHKRRNRHHWDHWVDEAVNPKPMLDTAIFEMISDWAAAGLAYKGVNDSREYFIKKGPFMVLAPETRDYIEEYYEVWWNPYTHQYDKWEEIDFKLLARLEALITPE